MKKQAVLNTTTLIHCKAIHVLHDIISTNQGNNSEMAFMAGATKINLKN